MPDSVLLVDDHPVVREGIKTLIEKEMGLRVSGSVAEAHEALAEIEDNRPDIVVLDLSLKNSSGFDLLLDMRKRWPDLPILVLSMYDEDVYAERVLRAEANGYIMKEEAPANIVTAIRRILSGGIYVSDTVAERILSRVRGSEDVAASPISSLSDRELQVFQMIGDGMTNAEIADRLSLSPKTIDTHVERIRKKLGAKNIREVLRVAIEWVIRTGERRT